MEEPAANRYRFHCEVVEVIYRDQHPFIKMVSNPGNLIIETSCDKLVKLGDKLVVTGELVITSVKKDFMNEYNIDDN